MSDRIMTCETFDEQLAEWLEDSLAPADAAAMESHMGSCLRCASIARGLLEIRSTAASLPELRPSRDLWSGIAARIEAPVIPIVAGPVEAGRWRRLRSAAIAAGLVIVTAGVTRVVTLRQVQSNMSSQVAVTPPPVTDGALTTDVPAPAPIDSAVVERQAEPATSPAMPRATRERTTQAPAARAVSRTPAQVTYDREIERLRAIVIERSAELDPRTVAVLENSLKVIDDAISQSRAALARDPASRFLNKQLNNALDKKLELLRTTALLPARS